MEKFNFVEKRASLQLADGSYKFDKMIKSPDFWSERAVTVAADKYLFGDKESSISELVLRVASHISQMNRDNIGDYYDDEFYWDLTRMLLNQRAAFNSPVWFNVGVGPTLGVDGSENGFYWDREILEIKQCENAYEYPQGSACFIVSIEDTMESIFNVAKTEAMLFKYGSGVGKNMSPIRSSKERLSNGIGTPSGPLSFMRIYDAGAGVVKSGGVTRRAAKLECMNFDHPDILDFINCKWREEEKAHALVAAGYSGGLDGEAVQTVCYQNSNISVRVSDEFMRAVEMHETYDTIAVTTGEPIDKLNASQVLMRIAEATWKCGDPGLQFDDTINYWHTCKNSGRINASNPCCFTGDTLVKTSEGDMTFDELMSTCDLPYAFAWDFKTNMPVLRKIKKVWRSGDSERLVRVTTDRGITVECTPEHRFYLRDGSSVEAQDLKSGMRLRKMPISQNAHRGGRRVIRHKSIPGNKRGEQWLSRFIWTQVNGEISDGVEIHHMNHDRTDDRLSNLGTIHDSDHRSHHSSGLNNGRAFHVDDFVMVEAYDEVASTENATHKGQEGSVNASRWNRYVRDNGLVGVLPIANSRGIQGKSWDEFHAWIEDRKCLVNDRVKSVQHIEMRVPVYDMEVEDVHNFTVTSPGNLHGIVVSNSEYMFLDDSACNLASMNLIKYLDDDDNFNVKQFAKDIRTLIRAMDALVDGCSYPTAQIAENSHKFRPLGLGYCNLGGLLMALGVPYDSDEGRAIASEITSYMTAVAYQASAMLAKETSAFDGFGRNRKPMLDVIGSHIKYSKELASGGRLIDDMTIDDAWRSAFELGKQYGYRNAQVTVLAPTGTISLFMDAETGGIEPFLGLISYKKLVGGGTLTKSSQLMERGLKRLGYDGEHLDKILEYIKNHNNVLTDLVKPEHQMVFETSFGEQALSWRAHVDMMAAVQPFLSGAISKSVNMPNDAIADDIYNAYHYAWRSGLKSIAIYRDGSKATQPESIKSGDDHIPDAGKMVDPQPATAEVLEKMKMDFDSVDLQVFDTLRELVSASGRVRLPDTRNSITHKFDIAGHEGYLTVGLYDNGQPGELFITISKEGSTIAGLLGVVGTLFSMAVQSGVPLSRICDKFAYSKFEPSGWTNNQEIGYAHSIVDYIFRWLKMRFVDAQIETEAEPMPNKETVKIVIKKNEIVTGEPCKNCSGTTVPSGACWVCTQCGTTTGCG